MRVTIAYIIGVIVGIKIKDQFIKKPLMFLLTFVLIIIFTLMKERGLF